MATRAKDTGKEKKATSPSPIKHHGRSTSTSTASKTTSPVKKQADPTTLNKNVPSYLKPTIAKAKKSASSSELQNNKTSLTRRKSFDNKPPLPASSSPRTRISPSPKERIPRSVSSLSAKTSTSQKPLLDRLSKTSKDATGRQRGPALSSRPVTKKKTTTTTTTTTRKHDSTNGSTTKASVITNSPDNNNNIPSVIPLVGSGEGRMYADLTPIQNSPDIDQNVISDQGEIHSEPEDHQELTNQETEKEIIITSDGEMAAVSDAGDNDSAMDDDHEEPDAHVNNGELEDIKAATDQSPIVEENQEIKIEEPEETQLDEEPEDTSNIEPNEHISSEKEKEQTVINESEDNQEPKEGNKGVIQETETAIVEETKAEPEKETAIVEETKAEPEKETAIVEETTAEPEKEAAIVEETKAEPEKNINVESSKPQPQVVRGKNTESAIVEETKAKPEKNINVESSKAQPQVVRGKNTESVVSNDVIEETATKLREKRKNRVRALAGAFGTVISRQEHK